MSQDKAKILNSCGNSHVMGTAVLGERGQLVIPKEVRDCYELKAGDKFFVMGHNNGPIAFIPINQMKDFISSMNEKIQETIKEN